MLGSNYYFWDNYGGANWPTHDPCGDNEDNHKKLVSNP